MRIASQGILNRDKEITFYFDSKPYKGFIGDTVASALLANDVPLFKCWVLLQNFHVASKVLGGFV